MCVNNLPKVVTQQCTSAKSNLGPTVTSGLQVRHVTVTIRLPSHRLPVLIIYHWNNINRGDTKYF